MKAQDKEFDDLFRSKLGDLEIEPSAGVWTGIDADLNGSKQRKKLAILSIAASIVVLVTAGLLFIPKNETGKPGPVKNRLAHNGIAQPTIQPKAITPVILPMINTVKPAVVNRNNNMAAVHQHKTIKLTVKPAGQNVPDDVGKPAGVEPHEQQLLASIPQKAEIVVKPVVPEVETPLVLKQAVASTTPDNTTPVLASEQPVATETAEPKAKKHKVRNFGDLVNLVVARVDKRKDKVIEFTDTDDDESTITAVNIGPIRINKLK